MINMIFPHLFLMAMVLLPSSVLGWCSILSRSGSRTTPRNRFFLPPRTKQIPFVLRMMARDGPLVRVSLEKPLGIQLEEIEAGAPGVRVAGLVEGGTAIKNGEISASMVLVELGGRDVTGATFDDVMEALVAAPAGIPIELTFRDPSSSSSSMSPPPVLREACLIRVVGADGGAIAVVKARTGDNLRSALLADKVDLYDMFGKVSNCNGGGQCGTCVVQVEEADGWDERSDWEAGKLKGRPESQRLACQTVIQGDATVMTKPPKRA